MEVPLQVAARLWTGNSNDPYIQTVDERTVSCQSRAWPLDAAFGPSTAQSHVYTTLSAPQLSCFLDGCDVSVVVFGQHNSGKTYTLIGQDVDSIYNEQRRGIIPRFLYDMFHKLSQMPERSFIIHLTWTRLVNGAVVDLLGCGLARCASLAEAFQYLVKGYSNKCYNPCHTVFTVSIEQKWIDGNGLLFHRLSTASFCELSAYPESSLNSVEDIIKNLIQMPDSKLVNYEQSLLTVMLRDSFGGRAFTWIICCLNMDPLQSDISLKTLDLCWCCRNIRNFVTVNGFADNNTPITVEKDFNRCPEQYFGLQFAAQQWIKLVSNAEGIFQKMLQNNLLSKAEVAQVNEWLFLKAECDECLNPALIELSENIGEHFTENKNILPRIAEEPGDSDVDSDTGIQHDDFLFTDKLCKYMEYFQEKTDELALERCDEYLHCGDAGEVESSNYVSTPVQMGRRKTIQPGESLTGSELELLRRAAEKAISPESQKIILESHKAYESPESKLIQRELLKIIDSPVPSESCKKYKAHFQKYTFKKNLIDKLSKAIQDGEMQLKELVSLCIAEQQLIQDLSKIVKRQNNVKQLCDKQSNIKEEFEKAKADLVAAQSKFISGDGNAKLGQQVRKCKSIVDHYERRMRDQELGKHIDNDNNKEIKKHESKLKSYKKRIDQIKKQIKRDEKRKNTLELELIKDKVKLDEMQNQDILNNSGDLKVKIKKQPTLKQVSTRLSHLDHILKEKASDLQRCDLSEDNESMLRREIKNLRKTRECLLDQQCILGHKRKVQKSLSDTEERKLLEYEEAIEAIDTAIEYKNELICGRGQSLVEVQNHRERGEELLMARLSKLSHNEMKTLFHKYFQKVIDLRSTCTGLEAAVGAAQQEAGGWRRRCADAWAALQYARLAHARRTTTLTARHYHTLNQLMREMAGDAESDSTVYSGIYGGTSLPLEYSPRTKSHAISSDVDKFLTQHSHIAATTAKFNVKDDVVEGNTNTRILNRIQQVARFHQSGIPSQNLKQLQSFNSDPTTKVTRQKNKLVIIQEDNTNK